jgi:hypothetical protein
MSTPVRHVGATVRQLRERCLYAQRPLRRSTISLRYAISAA